MGGRRRCISASERQFHAVFATPQKNGSGPFAVASYAPNATLVTIINEQTAKDVFPGEDPIGQFIENYGPKNEKLQVVGVVGNVRHLALETAPRPELYQPLGQGMWPLVNIAVRTAPENPVTLLPAVQQAVWSVNKSVALGNPRSMNEMIVSATFWEAAKILADVRGEGSHV